MSEPVTHYTFGDDDPALERLRLVAEAYRPTSADFLRTHQPAEVGLAVDLGCGPGFSTELLGHVCRPRQLLGLDASASFVDTARRRVRDADFVVHDAARTPLPGEPADLCYARLLLAHLPEPAGVAHRWREGLAPGGILLVEDLEAVEAPPGPLRDYEAVSAGVVRAGGGSMYGGRALRSLGGQCIEVRVPAAAAARIYLFNVDRWLAEPPPRTDRDVLTRLRAGLLEALGDGAATVAWLVRQLVLPR